MDKTYILSVTGEYQCLAKEISEVHTTPVLPY